MVVTYTKYSEIWDEVLHRLQPEIADTIAFNAFFTQTKLHSIDGDTAVISTQSNFSAEVLNRKFIEIIESVFNLVTQANFKCIIKEESKLVQPTPVSTDPAIEVSPSLDPFISHLNNKYTLETFVVGPSNQEAYFATVSTAMDPGKLYNPLFIYGKSGLGKTHLLHAAGNYMRLKFDNYRILYITSDDFLEEYVKAIKEKGIESMKERFRSIDALLIDDIQFLSSKEKTSEIFFNIFNQFIVAGKQIILTSDRAPNDLRGLEDRLVSRFASGLTVSVQVPEFETAFNILKKKVEMQDLAGGRIDEEVLEHIARKFSSDVRQLEGALNKLLFYAITFKKKDHITLSDAMETFTNLTTHNDKKGVTFEKIKLAVAEYYNISTAQLEAKLRTSNLVVARHIAIYLCHSMLDTTLTEIGNEFGGRDHSTVINAYEKVEKLLKENTDYQGAINDLKNMLKSG